MSDNFVPNKEYLVEVNNLKQYFPIKAGFGKTIPLKAVAYPSQSNREKLWDW